jgi:hypothetical protein
MTLRQWYIGQALAGADVSPRTAIASADRVLELLAREELKQEGQLP